jgi:hypothetical protein
MEAAEDLGLPFVEAVIRFTDPASAGAMLHAGDHESSTFQLEPHTVRIHDARALREPPSINREGFTLLRSAFEIDFADKTEVVRRYYPEAARLVGELTGASEVLVFLDLVRSETPGQGAELANNAHVDFDEPSLHAWIRMLRPDTAEKLVRRRIVNINLWRPLRPVRRMPLAVADARTVAEADLVRTLIGYKAGEAASPFAGYNLAYNPAQRWWCYPDMQPDEVLAFRLFDSDPRWRGACAHTAFVDPTSPADAPPRLSHEVRTIAILD